MSDSDPRRLGEQGPGSLRALIDSARDDEPTADELASIRVGLPVSPATPAAGASGGAAIASKVIVGLVIAAVTVPAVWFAMRREEAAPSAPVAVPVVVVPPPSVTVPVEVPPVVEVPAPAAAPQVVPRVVKKQVAPESAPPNVEAPAPTEFELISSAFQALKRGESAAALTLADQHELHFEHGQLQQEREVIRIEGLVGTGAVDRARERLQRFREAFPKSSHLVRLESLVATSESR